MDIKELRGCVPLCCEIAVSPVASFSPDGRKLIRSFQVEAKSVIILAHHVQASLEWAWFPFEVERGGTTCAADLHVKTVAEHLAHLLKAHAHAVAILPYPEACGISFKRLAAGTCLGEIGESALFLHRTWGPWVHLRVLITDSEVIEPVTAKVPVCTHCGQCLAACPGKTLSPGVHDLEACARQQRAARDALPIKTKYRPKCEICARVCPVGEVPVEAVVRDKE